MDEWEDLRRQLTAAGVAGAAELGRFVSNTGFFAPSRFDERAAMPVLIDALPTLTDAGLVAAVAGHLRRPWARPRAFDVLLAAFEVWARTDPTTGWALGDAVGTTATRTHVGELLRISQDRSLGQARQMVVFALGRFTQAREVQAALLVLIEDPDVALHAMGSLRKVIGSRAALPHLERVELQHRGTLLGQQAATQAKRARRAST